MQKPGGMMTPGNPLGGGTNMGFRKGGMAASCNYAGGGRVGKRKKK